MTKQTRQALMDQLLLQLSFANNVNEANKLLSTHVSNILAELMWTSKLISQLAGDPADIHEKLIAATTDAIDRGFRQPTEH